MKQTNSPSRGSGVTSPAAGMRHLPARRIPASLKDASSALVHLDLPHGSVEGTIGGEVRGGRRILDRLDRDAGETEVRAIGGNDEKMVLRSPTIPFI